MRTTTGERGSEMERTADYWGPDRERKCAEEAPGRARKSLVLGVLSLALLLLLGIVALGPVASGGGDDRGETILVGMFFAFGGITLAILAIMYGASALKHSPDPHVRKQATTGVVTGAIAVATFAVPVLYGLMMMFLEPFASM